MLTVVLAPLALEFVGQPTRTQRVIAMESEDRLTVVILNLIDVTRLASLVLPVSLQGCPTMVSEFDDVRRSAVPCWLRQIDSLELKTRLLGAIVPIAGTRVPIAFMHIAESTPYRIQFLRQLEVGVHAASPRRMLGTNLAFVASGVLLELRDRWPVKPGVHSIEPQQETLA